MAVAAHILQPYFTNRTPLVGSPESEALVEQLDVQPNPRQPRCRTCNELAIRQIASPLNPRNSGRPYYICPFCPWDYRWVCWADSKGVRRGNPPCDCKVPSRLDVIGRSKPAKAGRAFWTCVKGICDYYSENMDGTPGVSYGGFYP